MISFLKLMEQMDSSRNQVRDESIAAIRAGINIRPDFWDDFIRITSADGLSELLDIPKEKITGWAAKIMESMDRIGKMDDAEAGSQKSKPI